MQRSTAGEWLRGSSGPQVIAILHEGMIPDEDDRIAAIEPGRDRRGTHPNGRSSDGCRVERGSPIFAYLEAQASHREDTVISRSVGGREEELRTVEALRLQAGPGCASIR